ncbi:hypothetical protein G6F65_018357 [Rhizopus arrhizus]|nr:hypothetical protein G6F65_018357 [Rhizopus arrhizus]
MERREDAQDRRAKTQHLTAAGHELRAQVEDVLVELRRRLFQGVSEADLQACLRVFDALKLPKRHHGALSGLQHWFAASVLGNDHRLRRGAALVGRRALQSAVPPGRHLHRVGRHRLHGAAAVEFACRHDGGDGAVGGRLPVHVGAGPHPAVVPLHAGRLHRRDDRLSQRDGPVAGVRHRACPR